MKIEMSSVLFTGKSPSAHNFIVLNSLEIVFVDCIAQFYYHLNGAIGFSVLFPVCNTDG